MEKADDKITAKWRTQLTGMIPELASEERKTRDALLALNVDRAKKHSDRGDAIRSRVEYRIKRLAELAEIGEPAMTTESGLSSITRNGDFLAGFKSDNTTARFVCMLLDIFPKDEIKLNGVVVKPVDKPMSFDDMIDYWLKGGGDEE